jgi:hypothetical protein
MDPRTAPVPGGDKDSRRTPTSEEEERAAVAVDGGGVSGTAPAPIDIKDQRGGWGHFGYIMILNIQYVLGHKKKREDIFWAAHIQPCLYST